MTKFLKRIILLTISLFNLLVASVHAQQPDSSNLEISIVTCDYGQDFSSAFGHVAIRVKELKNKRDIIFDYGTFTFNESFFVLKFMRGDLLYYLSIREFDRFYSDYTYENRTVTETKLNLTPAQKIRIFNDLKINYRPKNRYYKYEFITDNCATRIRNIFAHPDFSHTAQTPDSTFRQYINFYLDNKKWLQLGIDILLGQGMDKKANFDEVMYLPYTIEANLQQFTNNVIDQPLAYKPTTLIKGEVHTDKFDKGQPLVVFTLILIVVIFLYIKKLELLHRITPYFYSILSLIGIIALFMWFGSRYPCTKQNWNILWTLPLYPLLLLPLGNNVKIAILKIATVLLASILIFGWWAIPQYLNPAVYPIVASIILINLNEIRLRNEKWLKR